MFRRYYSFCKFNKTVFLSVCLLPTCVESLEANVISKFPFKPSKDGTRIKISETCTKTSVCCNDIITVELLR